MYYFMFIQLKSLIPSLKIEIIPESGHVLYSDNNYWMICEKIIEFCDRSLIRNVTIQIPEVELKMVHDIILLDKDSY